MYAVIFGERFVQTQLIGRFLLYFRWAFSRTPVYPASATRDFAFNFSLQERFGSNTQRSYDACDCDDNIDCHWSDDVNALLWRMSQFLQSTPNLYLCIDLQEVSSSIPSIIGTNVTRKYSEFDVDWYELLCYTDICIECYVLHSLLHHSYHVLFMARNSMAFGYWSHGCCDGRTGTRWVLIE